MSANDLMGGYWLNEHWELYGGVRYVYTKMELEVYGNAFILVDEGILDYQVGFGYKHQFTPKWFVGFNADTMIAGENDRDYLLNGLFGYRISNLNNFWFGWRYFVVGIDSVAEDGTPVESDFIQSGPTVGWAFTF